LRSSTNYDAVVPDPEGTMEAVLLIQLLIILALLQKFVL
jgi:hypothetical protein